MKIFWLFLLCLPILARASTSEGSIRLYNDTTFILTAIILASDGSYLGQSSIQPGQQRNFTTNFYPTTYKRPATPDISITPYTVIWQCPSEGIFSMCTGVQPGALVRASWCDGDHFCTPKKEEKKVIPPASAVLKKEGPEKPRPEPPPMPPPIPGQTP